MGLLKQRVESAGLGSSIDPFVFPVFHPVAGKQARTDLKGRELDLLVKERGSSATGRLS